MEIEYSAACNGSNASTSGGELSLGWILIIVFFGVIFLYCLIGYIICAKKNPENGWGNVKANTPHLSFWCSIPKYTWVGCCVTKEFTMNKINEWRGTATTATGGAGYDSVDDDE